MLLEGGGRIRISKETYSFSVIFQDGVGQGVYPMSQPGLAFGSLSNYIIHWLSTHYAGYARA